MVGVGRSSYGSKTVVDEMNTGFNTQITCFELRSFTTNYVTTAQIDMPLPPLLA